MIINIHSDSGDNTVQVVELEVADCQPIITLQRCQIIAMPAWQSTVFRRDSPLFLACGITLKDVGLCVAEWLLELTPLALSGTSLAPSLAPADDTKALVIDNGLNVLVLLNSFTLLLMRFSCRLN